jgi:hypothetical protein
VFSEEELARLRGFPELGRAELIRHFTLTSADEAFLRTFRTGRLDDLRYVEARPAVPVADGDWRTVLAGQLGEQRPSNQARAERLRAGNPVEDGLALPAPPSSPPTARSSSCSRLRRRRRRA